MQVLAYLQTYLMSCHSPWREGWCLLTDPKREARQEDLCLALLKMITGAWRGAALLATNYLAS